MNHTDILQTQARALGHPTRHRLWRHLLAADAPVGVAELTRGVELNHNTVRQHLAQLVAAGLVTETVAPASGPGRPPLRYSVDPEARTRWDTDTGGLDPAANPYERLSELLLEVIATGDDPRRVGRRNAERFVAATPVADPLVRLQTSMSVHGFAPRVEGDDLVLGSCPFASAASIDPATVCALHRGITEGLVGDDVDLIVADPRTAGCRVGMTTGG